MRPPPVQRPFWGAGGEVVLTRSDEQAVLPSPAALTAALGHTQRVLPVRDGLVGLLGHTCGSQGLTMGDAVGHSSPSLLICLPGGL